MSITKSKSPAGNPLDIVGSAKKLTKNFSKLKIFRSYLLFCVLIIDEKRPFGGYI
ncbi:hypothetical protein FACS1894126_6120 [Alphaproteobacteria bacterium]|nr:hypothetical protein FACS1894126_6120 [Alphaproteobacteria bacterium]